MKYLVISAGVLSGIFFLILFDRFMDKLPAWSQSGLKYVIIAGIFAVVGDTVCGMFNRPSSEEIAAMRIDNFLSKAGNTDVLEVDK